MSEPRPASLGTLLLADDDELFREALAGHLQAAGYRCVQSVNSAEALARIAETEFDALISDIHMPGNADLGLVRAAAAAAPGLPILLLTGNPTLQTATQSVRLPVFAYLCKPFDRAEMLSLVAQAVAAGRTSRAVRASRQRLRGLDQELAEIEQRLGKPQVEGTESAANGFVRLTLRNLATCLGDLERSIGEIGAGADPAASLGKAELVTALRHTVEVLERTRKSFKSRELGELRHQLQSLLPKPEPIPGKDLSA